MKKFCIYLTLIICLAAFAGCDKRASDINGEDFERIIGDYQAVETEDAEDSIGGWWHLTVLNDDELGPYFSIYDNEAGNPGVEGKIYALDGESISVRFDPDLTDQLPSCKWELNGKYLELSYELNDDGIVLVNSDRAVEFKRDETEEDG